MKSLVVFFLLVTSLEAFAKDFPTGTFICRRVLSGNAEEILEKRITIQEVTLGSSKLPLVSFSVTGADVGGPQEYRGIASLKKSNGVTIIDLYYGTYFTVSENGKTVLDHRGECQRQEKPIE